MPNIFILFLFLLTLTPIFFRKLTAISNLGLSFLFNSPKFLKLDVPFAFAAIKKITKNSSIAALFKDEGQLKPLIFFELSTTMSEVSSPLYIFLFFKLILQFILFKIVIIPVRLLLIFIFLILILEFFERAVKTIKKALELISPGTT